MSQFNCDIPSRRRLIRLANLVLVPALIVSAQLCLTVSANAQESQQPWTLLDHGAEQPALSQGHSAIVILKLPRGDATENSEEVFATAAARKETVSVFIDGSYHASFPRPSWAYAEVCAGAHFLNVVRDSAALAVQENFPYGQRYELHPSSTSYFQLLDDNSGAPRLKAVDGNAASAVLKQLPKTTHTISRLESKSCAVDVDAVTPVKMPQIMPATKYTLQGSTLFAVDKFTLDSLRKDGREELDKIVRASRAKSSVIESVSITGYADPTGNAAYNLSLSQRRAQTIKEYLIKSGFSSEVTTASGKGAADPVVTDCGVRFKTKAQINSCNEPNRRVEVVVRGQSMR